MIFFLTIDVGTTSVKTALFDETGKLHAIALKEYRLHTPEENIVELETQIYWDCAVKGVHEVLRKSGVNSGKISSVGVSSQGETLITLDGNGEPVRPAIVWMDNRSVDETRELKERFGTGDTGLDDMITTWPVTKALWLRRNEPESFSRTDRFLMVEDYIIYKLTGQFAGEFSLYSTTSILDIRRKQYWLEILDYVGIGLDRLPALSESGDVIGKLTPKAASVLGLGTNTHVITGAMDQTAGMVGAGNIREGIISETTGAALAICKSLDTLPGEKKQALAIQCHAVPDKYLVTGWCGAGGMSLKWLRDTFFTEEKSRVKTSGEEDTYNLMVQMAEKVSPGSQGLQFYPFMAGPGTLPLNQSARGCFNGLELHHGKEHFVRAVMESMAFILRENIERMKGLGGNVQEVRSMGGGAKSPLWNQIKADVTGLPIVTLECKETASLGIAILSTVALGVHDSIESAVKVMVKPQCSYKPEKNASHVYENAYTKYLLIEKKFFGVSG